MSAIQPDLWWGIGLVAILVVLCYWLSDELDMPGHNGDDEEGGE